MPLAIASEPMEVSLSVYPVARSEGGPDLLLQQVLQRARGQHVDRARGQGGRGGGARVQRCERGDAERGRGCGGEPPERKGPEFLRGALR